MQQFVTGSMSATRSIPNLTGGRLLAKNTLWNLGGQLSPIVVAVLTIPLLVRGLGVTRFGVLSLAWVVIGYFSVFDVGLGRALTKLIAERLGSREEQAIPALIWTSLSLMLALGGLGCLATLAVSRWLVYSVLKIPADLQAETLHSFYLLALSIPLVTLTSGLRGVLEALQRFRAATLIRVPMSILSLAGPLLVLPFSRSLVWVTAVLLLVRLAGGMAHLIACFHAMPALGQSIVLDRSVVKPLIQFGGWMTVSNVINPILVYVDRFVLGAMVSASVIAYYTAPFDAVIRLTVIPAAVAGVLFPAFALTIAEDPRRTHVLLFRSLKYVFLLMFPITLIVVTLAPEGLRLWLGTSFAQNGTSVLRWLAAGVLANSLAHAPFALVQSAGRPDLTAKLHLVELPVYMLAVWMLTKQMGIEGTAIAWAARLVLDTVLICFFLDRILPTPSGYLVKVGSLMGAGLLLLVTGTLPSTVVIKLSLLSIELIAFGLVGWLVLLSREERMFLLRRKPNTQKPEATGVVTNRI